MKMQFAAQQTRVCCSRETYGKFIILILIDNLTTRLRLCFSFFCIGMKFWISYVDYVYFEIEFREFYFEFLESRTLSSKFELK